MAGQMRHLKVKGSRFYARLAVPKSLQAQVGKSELVKPLGADRRAAIRQLPSAVAELQREITSAERMIARTHPLDAQPAPGRYPMTPAQIAASHYAQRLALDEQFRTNPAYAQVGINDAYIAELREAVAGRASNEELTALMGREIESFRAAGNHNALPGSAEWREIARALCIAELEFMARMFERHEGDFTGRPENPMIATTPLPEEGPPPISLKSLFGEYVAARQAVGKHRDGGRTWEAVMDDLASFLRHDDAGRVTKRNLLDWRDHLLKVGKSPKTVANRYLAAVRAVFRWAWENDRLPTNEAATVRQETPKVQLSREKGYTDPEALKVLEFSVSYEPPVRDNPANRESAHITAAKRWVPILCAFSGARVTEMTQLRKEDIRKEGEHHIIRIRPDAGSVKAGNFRDVPLHPQIIQLGFLDFVSDAKNGPLFHNAKTKERNLAAARTTAGRLSGWLQAQELVPSGLQPNHAWRHRLKTQGRELGISDRVLDAIQGHAGRTAGDNYGDVNLATRISAIMRLPAYRLTKRVW